MNAPKRPYRLNDLRTQYGDSVEIVHLTRTPPFAPGSFTGIVANLMRRMTAYQQVAISYWDGPTDLDAKNDLQIILTSWKQLSFWQRCCLQLPTSLRSRLFSGVGGRGCLAYAWQVLEVLRVLRPKVVVCYDEPWMGRLIRKDIDWPCRVVFNQHGLSYFMSTENASRTYSLQSFDSVWTLTAISYRFDREHLPHYEPAVRVLPNPIDTELFFPASPDDKSRARIEWGLPQDRTIVLFLSVLRPKKGAHLLLQCWPEIIKQVPDAYLWVVGGGDAAYEKYLHDMATALGVLDSVRFQGRVPGTQTPSCYRAADMYVFPTLFVEGMPLSLGEAMSSGLACVASEHSVSREAYAEGGIVFVSDPNLEGAFVQPILRFLADGELRQQMGSRAREFLESHYSYAAVLPLVERAFSLEMSLVSGSAPQTPHIPIQRAVTIK